MLKLRAHNADDQILGITSSAQGFCALLVSLAAPPPIQYLGWSWFASGIVGATFFAIKKLTPSNQFDWLDALVLIGFGWFSLLLFIPLRIRADGRR